MTHFRTSTSRISFFTPAVILSAAIFAFVLAGTQPTVAAEVTSSAEDSVTPPFPVACARADLDLVTAIEQYQDTELYASPTLADAATLLQYARTVCENGDVAEGLATYSTANRQLASAFAELDRMNKILQARRAAR